jgi:hypothetical protein
VFKRTLAARLDLGGLFLSRTVEGSWLAHDSSFYKISRETCRIRLTRQQKEVNTKQKVKKKEDMET